MVALPLPRRHRRGGGGRFLKKSSRQRRGRGSIFFENIEKLHESGRISVFTNETP
jgi:hypothetical protein